MSRLTLVVCAAQLLAMGATAMAAQESDYDEKALRVESHRGDLRIVRGLDGTVVAKSGVFRGPDVASVVGSSSNALAEAKIFQRDYGPGTTLAALGIATLGATFGAWRIEGLNQTIPTGLLIVGVSLITYGGTKMESAYRALSKAIWWYNRDLKK